jgi:hypothetical protein
MLNPQREIIAVAAQVEVGIAPGVKLRGAAQRLTGADASRPPPADKGYYTDRMQAARNGSGGPLVHLWHKIT